MIRDQRRGANIKLRPFLPFSLLYPPTSRPAGVRFDRPRTPFFSPPLTPPQRPEGGKERSPGPLRSPPRCPQSPRHTPGGKALILPAATEPAQMLQTPLTCLDAMMEPSPQGRRGQRRRGRSCRARVTPRGPSIPGARGGASDGKGMAPGDWLAGYAPGRGRGKRGRSEWRCLYPRSRRALRPPPRILRLP